MFCDMYVVVEGGLLHTYLRGSELESRRALVLSWERIRHGRGFNLANDVVREVLIEWSIFRYSVDN